MISSLGSWWSTSRSSSLRMSSRSVIGWPFLRYASITADSRTEASAALDASPMSPWSAFSRRSSNRSAPGRDSSLPLAVCAAATVRSRKRAGTRWRSLRRSRLSFQRSISRQAWASYGVIASCMTSTSATGECYKTPRLAEKLLTPPNAPAWRPQRPWPTTPQLCRSYAAGAYPGAYRRGTPWSGWTAWTFAATKQHVRDLQRSR